MPDFSATQRTMPRYSGVRPKRKSFDLRHQWDSIIGWGAVAATVVASTAVVFSEVMFSGEGDAALPQIICGQGSEGMTQAFMIQGGAPVEGGDLEVFITNLENAPIDAKGACFQNGMRGHVVPVENTQYYIIQDRQLQGVRFMIKLRGFTLSIPLLVSAASVVHAQESGPTFERNTLDSLRGEIVECGVDAQGAERIVLRNGDDITNADWFHDSFAVAVEDPEGDSAILNPATGELIQVSDICVRTDIQQPEHPNLNMNIDYRSYDYMCVSNGLFVEVFDVENGGVLPLTGPITATFHRVQGDETILGSCEFEVDGVQMETPMISYASERSIPQ